MTKVKLSFEEAMKRLEQIVRAMEQGDVALDESLKLFQEGTELVQTCSAMLEKAQMQIELVTKGADGAPVIKEFKDEI